MVQFDTIIFGRTFKNYFGQFVWIEKRKVTIIVAFHFMKRRLKTSRERPNSVPYLRLQNSKRTQSVKVFSSTVPEKPKSSIEFAHQRGHSEIFHLFCRKSSKKIEGGFFGEFFSKKKSHRIENTLREYPLVPLSFKDDVKILLRKLSKNCKKL